MVKFFIPFTLLPFFLSSCQPKEDPDTLRALDEVRAENESLAKQAEEMTEEIKALKAAKHIVDHSEELAALQSKIDEALAQQPVLKEKIEELEKAKKKAAKDLEDYKSKYLLRSN